jgi:hypothetical protein
MPLSNDFANNRLEYLQSAIKNNNTVTAQFYPRFQRHYNEMFPFTEGSLFPAKIENPQQPVVSSSLNAPTLQMAKENLKTKLISYVGQDADFIINALTDIQILYYEENFNEIQKDLLKRIKIPTSKSSYLTNLRMVLSSDKNRSNLSIYNEPAIPPTSIPIKRKIKRETLPSSSSSSDDGFIPQNLFNEGALNVRHGNRSDLLLDRIYMAQQQQLLPQENPLPRAPEQLPPVRTPRRFASNKIVPFNNGFGISSNKKLVSGRGIQSREIKHKKEFHKYAIDLKKLRHNILALKYLKNANNVATFNPIEISKTLKEFLEHFLHDEKQIDSSDFEKLSHTEKRILKRLYSFLKIDFDFDYDDQFQKRFEVMYGSFLAGNDNEDLIKELKEYIKLAVHENIISKDVGRTMMNKLDK